MGIPRRNRPFSRRSVLQGAGLSALTAAGLTGLGACAGPPGGTVDGVPEIQFWHLLGGGDGIRMEGIVNTVNEEMTDAQIKATVLAWGPPYYTKLAMASAGGRAPDLGVVHMSRLAGYAPGGLLDAWDLDRLATYDVGEDTFTSAAWQSATINGEIYALALDSHAFVTFFNPDLSEQAGLLESDGTMKPITSLDDLLDVGRAYKDVTGGEYGITYGFLGDAAQMWRLFWTFYTQHGATFELLGDEFVYDAEAFGDSVEAMRRIVDGEIASTSADYGTAISAFLNEDVGMIFSGPWELPTFQDSGMPLAAMPTPNIFGTGIDASWGDSHTFVLPHQDHPDPERRELTYQAVSRILKGSLPWGGAGHTPAYQPIVESPEFAALEPNNQYSVTAEFLKYDPPASFTGSGSNFGTQFGGSIQGALIGQTPVLDAVADFAARVNVLMSKAVNP